MTAAERAQWLTLLREKDERILYLTHANGKLEGELTVHRKPLEDKQRKSGLFSRFSSWIRRQP